LNRDNQQVFAPLANQGNDAPFAEPWQAQVMALAFAASQKGIFTPVQWSEALGTELRENEAEGFFDDRSSYYQAALRALETLLLASGKLAHETVVHREAEWRRAYLNTPHGMPVELSAGTDI
jgi:nitrile hydratase accessory protein